MNASKLKTRRVLRWQASLGSGLWVSLCQKFTIERDPLGGFWLFDGVDRIGWKYGSLRAAKRMADSLVEV